MTKRKKQIKNEQYEESWIYILLLATLVILIESLKNYSFQIDRLSVTYAIFLLPFIYLLTNYITKKYGSERSIVAISVSGIGMIIFCIMVNFILGKNFSISLVNGQFCGYVVSQFINLLIYNFLLGNTEQPFFMTFLTYMFSLITFYMFYTLIELKLIIEEDFWISYFTVLIIQSMICIGLALIDKKIKRGIDSN